MITGYCFNINSTSYIKNDERCCCRGCCKGCCGLGINDSEVSNNKRFDLSNSYDNNRNSSHGGDKSNDGSRGEKSGVVKEIVITRDESNIYDKVVFKYEDGEEEVLGRNLKITCEKEVGFDVCYDISQYNIDDNVKVTCKIGKFYVIAIANLDNKNDIIICKTCKKNINDDFSECFSEYFEMEKSKTRYNYLKILAANINDACGIFENCWRLKKLDLRNFDTSNISNMCNMFSFCYDLSEIIGLCRFNTSKVDNMKSMFYHCKSLKELNLSKFNTSNVTDMHSMFDTCESLKFLNLSSFYTSNVTCLVCLRHVYH